MENRPMNRRGFFKFAMATLALLGLKPESMAAGNCSATPPKGKAVLDPKSAQATRLDYVVTASESKNPKFKAGQDCSNCSFYKLEKEESGHAPCTMMGNKYVTSCGWCKSYKEKKKA